MTNRVLVLGYFGYSNNHRDGQAGKTRNVFDLLKSNSEHIGSIDYFDTQKFQHTKLSFLKMVWKICLCEKLVYIPAQNNLTYGFPFIYLICKYKHIDILYILVGGWLAEYLQKKKLYIYLLSNIRCIFPESNQLKDKLISKFGFDNVVTLPNFRIQSFNPVFIQEKDVFKIVFMARINRMKGIDAVFRLASYIEKRYNGMHSITIDFYGPIANNDKDSFLEQIKKYKFVSYRGILEPNDIYNTLNRYDVLVLPTKYYREGFPGSILDAYISGLPVIVSNWEYSSEFIDDGKTGFIFDLKKEEEFYYYVDKLYIDRNLLLEMKQNAFEKSKMYSSEKAWDIIRDYLI